MTQHFANHDSNSRAYPIRVLRVEPGGDFFVRTLAAEYGGLFYHWSRGRSEYCEGQSCPAALHHTKSCWKGYTPVEVWVASAKEWRMHVLEISEHLEHDLRGVFGRGQVWSVSRPAAAHKKNSPILGRLHEQLEPSTVPMAFDIVPTLLRMFHVTSIRLDHRNPLPMRSMATPSRDPGPSAIAQHQGTTPTLKHDELHQRLVAEGLVPPRNNGSAH
jgi:hypothetical protein